MIKPLKIGILGAGSIGCFVGGKLSACGHDLVFVGRERIWSQIQSHSGLLIQDFGRGVEKISTERFQFKTEIESLRDREFILCCLKSHQTSEAAESLAKVLPASSPAVVVSFQNGLRNPELLRASLGARPVWPGIVGFNVVSGDDGVFRRTTSGQLIIGAEDSRAGELAAALRDGGFDVRVTENIRPLQYSKLIINLINALSALSGCPTRELLLDRNYRRLLAAIMEEGLRVIREAGIRVGKLGPLPPGLFPALLRLPTPIFRVLAHAQVQIDPAARSSMWEDLKKGRPTEVDFLNGEIVRLAKERSGEAPLNARIVRMIQECERAGRGVPGLSARDLSRELFN